MKRRDTLKTMLVGTVAGVAIGSNIGCSPDDGQVKTEVNSAAGAGEKYYGRIASEIEHDKKVNAEIFLNEHELSTIAVLCDIILPKTATAGSATEAKVPEFIAFIVKDIPSHQVPLRGGLMWLEIESNRRFNTEFKSCTVDQQIQIIDDIAYPDPDNKKPEMAPGIKFFGLMRDLTMTGYYTTRMGFDDLGYDGNYANVWDGVPAEVLKDHDVEYDAEWVAKCIDQSKREVIAEWDADMNLLT